MHDADIPMLDRPVIEFRSLDPSVPPIRVWANGRTEGVPAAYPIFICSLHSWACLLQRLPRTITVIPEVSGDAQGVAPNNAPNACASGEK